MSKIYCHNCMELIDEKDKICPYCGITVGSYVPNQRALKPYTILEGKYLLGRVLGEGGFGITYLGIDLNLKIKVAIKEYFPSQCATRNTENTQTNTITIVSGEMEHIFRKGFEDYSREAQRLAALEKMPGIVRVMNFFCGNNTAYMVMEYVQGVTLKEYLRQNKGRIHWKKALELMRPVIDSLAVVHKSGIIHRDISLDNVMLDGDGNITLIDFGAARETDTGKSMTITLKHGYAPAEQYQTHGNQGPWTDVYALCATLYRMISGRALPDAMSIYSGRVKLRPIRSFDKSIPSNIDAAVMKGLEVKIADRIQSMEELSSFLYGGKRAADKGKSVFWVLVTVIALFCIISLVLFFSNHIRGQIGGDYDAEKASMGTELVQEDNDQKQSDVSYENGSSEKTDDETEEGEKDSIPDIDTRDTASAYVAQKGLSYTQENLLSFEENIDGVKVTDSDYTITEIVIPEEIGGKPVTEIGGIGKNATLLVIPDSVKKIDANAFKNCVYLESIYIPSSVDNIGNNAFENCPGLSDIHISDDNMSFRVQNGKIMDRQGSVIN